MLSSLQRFIVAKVSDTELAESFDDMCVPLYPLVAVQRLVRAYQLVLVNDHVRCQQAMMSACSCSLFRSLAPNTISG